MSARTQRLDLSITGDVFRCDYCGMWKPLSDARIFWTVDDDLDAATVYVPAVYCCDFCGKHGSMTRVGG